MAGVRWLPNVEGFFTSRENDLRRAVQVSLNCDGESAYYWLTRLENVKEVFSLFYTRVYEADEDRLTVLGFITSSLEDVQTLRIQFIQVALRTAEMEEPVNRDVLYPNRAPLQHTSGVGQLNFQSVVSESQLRFLHEDIGLLWVDIARCLGICERTLKSWWYQFGLTVNRNFANLTDDQLDTHVRDILQNTPNVDLSLTKGALRARGLTVQRERVREAMNKDDPLSRTVHHTQFITRRAYNVRSPNSLGHIDGNHKLIQPYRFVIHCGIDGYSRMIVYLKASIDNKADTVLKLFQEAVHKYNVPSRVRNDLGLENIQVARFMLNARGLNRKSITTGTSVHNQRIERLWRDVNRVIVSRFLNIFLYLEHVQLLDVDNEIDLMALQLTYVPIINEAIKQFVGEWSNHPISTQSNYSPQQLWFLGMFEDVDAPSYTVQEILMGQNEMDSFGVDEAEADAIEEEAQSVVEPPSPYQLTEQQNETVNYI